MATTTRTRSAKKPPTPAQLKLSPEVAWYLESRGIPLPTCPPRLKTPEPRQVRGARFDPDRVDRVLASIRLLRHTQGRWAGRPLNPDPWQVAYIIAPVFGWVAPNEDGVLVRVIRDLYVDIPRKNGKTTLAGGLGVYLLAADGEAGGQVYAVAASKEQAKFCFGPVKTIAEKSPALKRHVVTTRDRIVHTRSGSYFAVVSALGDLMHGANIQGAVVDELHVHKTKDLLEAVETGTASRDQPLVIVITTPDDGRTATPYDQRRRLIEQLAARTLTNPSMYGVIWGATLDDDPFDEETIRRANPGYGISPTKEFMRSAMAKAKASPADLASYQRLHLGIRTKQRTRYLDLQAWDAAAGMVDEAKLVGRRAFGGLDLGATSDLTALSWVFPDGEGGYDVLVRLWAPEDSLDALNKRTAGNAEAWVRAGLLTVTPGNVTDYEFIRAQVNADREKFDVEAIGYDRWNATDIVSRLTDDGAPMESLGQGYAGMSAPTKELQRLVLASTPERPLLRHGGNPALRWQVDNFAAAMDPAGNVKPDKARAGDKIDGVVAVIIGLRFAIARSARVTVSAYEDSGLEVV